MHYAQARRACRHFASAEPRIHCEVCEVRGLNRRLSATLAQPARIVPGNTSDSINFINLAGIFGANPPNRLDAPTP